MLRCTGLSQRLNKTAAPANCADAMTQEVASYPTDEKQPSIGRSRLYSRHGARSIHPATSGQARAWPGLHAICPGARVFDWPSTFGTAERRERERERVQRVNIIAVRRQRRHRQRSSSKKGRERCKRNARQRDGKTADAGRYTDSLLLREPSGNRHKPPGR